MKYFISLIFLFFILSIFIISCKSDNEIIAISGCTNSDALNYNVDATLEDGSCIYPIEGCTDSLAINYNTDATQDDNSCIYDNIPGCTDLNAINYNPQATQDDDSCEYAGDDFLGEYIGSLNCSGLIDLINTDSLFFTIDYWIHDPGDKVQITLYNIGSSFQGEVSGNNLIIEAIIPNFIIPDLPSAIDLFIKGMLTLSGNIISGELDVAVHVEGTIETENPLATEKCAMSGTRL